jgi:predicted phage terminase large subunit-like protein
VLTELLNSTNCSKLTQAEELTFTEEIAKVAGEMAIAEKSFKQFVKQAWHIIEPGVPFIDGYHIDVICEHLEAVYKLQIQNLIINIPPRHMKSLLVSVFFPAWVWLNDPYSKWLCSSYGQDLSTRDSLKCRRLIQSLWYQSRWSDKYTITSDQNQKTRFENDKTGYRLSTSVDGVATGEGGDYVVVDDAHNVKQAESETKRLAVLKWWDEVMSTRINNPKTGRFIIVMQRVHEKDLTGHVLAKENSDYVHLCLPARYEVDREPKILETSIGFKDKRTKDGDPLWPDMYDDKELKKLEDKLGSYAAAGQLQQRPSPREGGMFNVTDFKIVDKIGKVVRGVRYWDKAGTEGGGCYTAGVLVYKLEDGSYLIADVVRGQWEAPERERRIKQMTILDGKSITQWVEQEGGSGGKESAQATIKNLAGYTARADRVTGSKIVRAEPYSAQVAIGNVKVLNRPWTNTFLDEHGLFPMGGFKDQVDSASGAFNKLASGVVAGVMGAR